MLFILTAGGSHQNVLKGKGMVILGSDVHEEHSGARYILALLWRARPSKDPFEELGINLRRNGF